METVEKITILLVSSFKSATLEMKANCLLTVSMKLPQWHKSQIQQHLNVHYIRMDLQDVILTHFAPR